MEDFEITEQKSNFVCFRCGCIIKPGEKMVSSSVTIETPTEDDELNVIESTAISTLCLGCASVLLSQAITRDPSLMMPSQQESGILKYKEYNEPIVKSADEELPLGSVWENPKVIDSLGELEDEVSISGGEEDKPRERLTIRHSREGFCLVLDCGDGISEATSRFFTWRQLAQMLIAMDPDMFGVLSEPLHQVFPQALSRLGYHVPNWRESQTEDTRN